MSDGTKHPHGSDDAIRASDADREATAGALRHHHSDGRLTDDEFQDRFERSLAAKTLGDLRSLVKDLPGGGPAASGHNGAPWRRWFVPLPVLLAIVALTAVLGRGWHAGVHHHRWFPWPPLLLLIGVAVLLRRRRCQSWSAMDAC